MPRIWHSGLSSRIGRRLAAMILLATLVFPLSQAEIAGAQPPCVPMISIDTPADNVTLRQATTLVGWAIDISDGSSVGVDAVHVYLDGEVGAGGVLLGAATMGTDRPDVAAVYGRNRDKAGFSFAIDPTTSAVGGHALYIYAHTRCGWAFERRGINVAPRDGWALLNPPPARNSHAAVWDPQGGQMLAVGGRGAGSLADLWSYRPSTETWMPLVGPSVALVGHTAVWDESSAQMLVYGGFGGGNNNVASGLWSYRPSTKQWSQLAPVGPSPRTRAYHAAVWDPNGGQMLVFGGIGGSFESFNDVWSYQPSTNAWTELSPNVLFSFGLVPEGRFYHSAVWDPTNAQMLVFAGASPQYGLLDDLWSYDPGADVWTELEPPGFIPPARLSQGAVWDPVRSRMLVFAGGCGGCYLDDFWSYDPAENAWSRVPVSGNAKPGARGGHSAVWESTHGEMLVFGGSVLNDVWTFQPTTNAWRQRVSREAPVPASAGQRAVWDPAGGRMLVFGGRNSRDGANPLDSISIYTPSLNAWRVVSTTGAAPSPRLGHSVALDPASGRVLLFGGSGGDGKGLTDLWAYDLARNAWTQLTPDGQGPSARAVHSAVWDPVQGQMLVYGGAPESSGALDDLWSYQPTANRWTRLAPTGAVPAARSRQSAVWDAGNRQMLVFGGYAATEGGGGIGGYSNELWSYNPTTNAWSRAATTGVLPPARARHTATWDPEGAQMIIFGGYVGGVDFLADLWSYAPSTGRWTRLDEDSAAPRSRGDHSAVWDPTGAGLLLYGGSGGDVSNELWSYRPGVGPLRPVGIPLSV